MTYGKQITFLKTYFNVELRWYQKLMLKMFIVLLEVKSKILNKKEGGSIG